MKMTYLGVKSAFTLTDYQTNVLLERNGQRLLLDCGGDIRFSLRDVAGLKLTDVTDVYISHAHADHSGGLEGVALCTYFNPNCERPRLFVARQLASPLWSDTLSGGLKTLQGTPADIDTFFEVRRIGNNGSFVWQGITFKIVQSIHIYDGLAISPSYGLMFESGGQRIFWTSDTQHAPNQLHDFYAMSDVIYHDCETSPFPSGVHAHYTDLVNLPAETKSKMWLHHYNDGPLPDAVADGFRGFVLKGQQFEF
jgi:ribonuclease BN (tRNA processing enzyme)